jgi:hypothetical protein
MVPRVAREQVGLTLCDRLSLLHLPLETQPVTIRIGCGELLHPVGRNRWRLYLDALTGQVNVSSIDVLTTQVEQRVPVSRNASQIDRTALSGERRRRLQRVVGPLPQVSRRRAGLPERCQHRSAKQRCPRQQRSAENSLDPSMARRRALPTTLKIECTLQAVTERQMNTKAPFVFGPNDGR